MMAPCGLSPTPKLASGSTTLRKSALLLWMSSLKDFSHHSRMEGISGNARRLKKVVKDLKYMFTSVGMSEAAAGRSTRFRAGKLGMFSELLNSWHGKGLVGGDQF